MLKEIEKTDSYTEEEEAVDVCPPNLARLKELEAERQSPEWPLFWLGRKAYIDGAPKKNLRSISIIRGLKKAVITDVDGLFKNLKDQDILVRIERELPMGFDGLDAFLKGAIKAKRKAVSGGYFSESESDSGTSSGTGNFGGQDDFVLNHNILLQGFAAQAFIEEDTERFLVAAVEGTDGSTSEGSKIAGLVNNATNDGESLVINRFLEMSNEWLLTQEAQDS